MTRRAIDRHDTGVRIALTSPSWRLLIGGCGGAPGGDRPDEDATLLLDFAPNAVHAGIYLATARGYDEAEGVRLEVRRPGASTDALKQLQTGRADLAILDIHDLGLARERGRDVVGVYAIVQRPLAAVIARPGIARPRDLEGRRAGVTGLPSDEAVLRSVVAGDGGDPDRVRATTIGFEAVKALLAGRVDAATAFWNAEGVALSAAGRASPSSAWTSSARRGIPSWCCASPARRSRSADRWCARRSGRCSAATCRRRRSPTARWPRCSSRRAGATGPSSPAARRRLPRLHRRRPRPGRAARGRPAQVGRLGPPLRDPLEAARRLPGVRLRPGGPGPQPLISRSAARPARRPRGPSASAARRGRSPPHRARRLVSASTCE